MTSTITFSGVEGNKFDGDKTINGNLILQNGVDRSIYIANAATATAGDDLTIRAGDGTGTGNRNGGDLYLHGGDAANSGTDGDTILGFVNGGAARGYVGVRMVPSVTLDITGDANLGDDSIRFAHSRSDGGIRLDNNSVDGVEWYIDSTGTGSGYGTGKLAFVAGIGGTNVLTLASTAVVVGAAAAYADNGEFLEVNKSADDGGIGLFCWSTTDAERALIEFHKSASATIGTKALVADDEACGGIVWRAADSASGWSTLASIEGYIDAAPGDNDTAGRLVFSTTADGAASPTERLRIDSAGDYGFNSTAPRTTLPPNLSNPTFANARYIEVLAAGDNAPTVLMLRNNSRTYGLDISSDNNNAIVYFDSRANVSSNRIHFRLKTAGTAITPMILGPTDITLAALLQLQAGAAAASSAPLKFATGPLLTTPEAGAVEHLGDGFYVTPTTTVARQQVATDSNAIFWEGEIVSWEDDMVLAA